MNKYRRKTFLDIQGPSKILLMIFLRNTYEGILQENKGTKESSGKCAIQDPAQEICKEKYEDAADLEKWILLVK